jgi:hypothetical protein
MSRSKSLNQAGFTILELIATMIFSVIFLSATTALIQIGKLYYKGVIGGRTQETTRGLTDQISQQLQFSPNKPIQATSTPFGLVPSGSLNFEAYCIGSTRYSFRLNAQVNGSVTSGHYDATSNQLQHALWRDSIDSAGGGGCVPANLSLTTPSATGEEVLGQNMRLSQFSSNCGTDNICNLSVGIIYGDNGLITPLPSTAGVDPATLRCDSIIGNQWCSASQFSTSVLQRVIGN